MLNNIIVRLVAYYVTVIVVASGIFHLFPILGVYVNQERMREGARASVDLTDLANGLVATTPELSDTMQLLAPEKSVPILLSLVAAMLVVLPVVWVYRWTRPRKRYSQAFAHTLLVVPIAITLVVFLAKGSLALAFSLAGIVAAVRFRTSLDDSMDAVYMFIVIGAGLAAGVQLLAVAVIASMLFNAVALTVWRLDFGSSPATLNGWRLAEPQPPARNINTVETVTPESSVEEPGKPFNARLSLQATQAEPAQHSVIAFLEQHVKRWQIVEITPQDDGTSIIEFDLRIKKSVDRDEFVRAIEQGDPHVMWAELSKLGSKKD